jgi:hypothetical protein
MGFEVLTAMGVKSSVSWDMTLQNLFPQGEVFLSQSYLVQRYKALF